MRIIDVGTNTRSVITEPAVPEPVEASVDVMSEAEVKETVNWFGSLLQKSSDSYVAYKESIEPAVDSMLEQASDIKHCLAMDMSDLEIYEHFIKTVYNKYDIPFGKWETILTANWSNLQNRVNAINEMKLQLNILSKQENGEINTEQYNRCKTLLYKGMEGYQGAQFKEVYNASTEPSIVLEREVIDKIENFWNSKGWMFKLGVGVVVVAGLIIGMFIFYNFVKSYGTEKGKRLAQK